MMKNGGVLRWHGQLIGPHGKPVLVLTKWDTSDPIAHASAAHVLRDLQTGYRSSSQVERRAIQGTDPQAGTTPTRRGKSPQGWTPEWWVLAQRDHDWSCAYCGKATPEPEIEHVIPLARGGRDDITNIVPACKACNRDKNTMTGAEYLAWRTRRRLPVRLQKQPHEGKSQGRS